MPSAQPHSNGRVSPRSSPQPFRWMEFRSTLRLFVRQPGFVAALASLFLGIMWVAAVRPLNAPDEPAHLQAIMEARKNRRLPEVHYDFTQPGGAVIGAPGDQSVRDYTVSLGINDAFRLTPYESMQPPLYYIISALVGQLAPPNPQTLLYLGRLVSALFGAVAVYFYWAAAREFAPRSPMWAVGAAGVVAFLPQFCFNNATAANDSLASAASATAFYIWFRGLRRPQFDPWMLGAGAIMGVCILSKLTTVALLPGLALVVLFRAFQVGSGLAGWKERGLRFLRMSMGAGGAALAVCGWWLLRNVVTYGEISGSRDAIEFYKGKFQTLDIGNPESVNWFVSWSWESAWGRFGWMDITLPPEFYEQARNVTFALLALSGLAFLVAAVRALWLRHGVPTHSWQATLVMASAVAVLLVGYVQFSQTVAFQPQARYFFPVLLPAALLFTGGLHALLPGRAPKWIALSVLLLWLAWMNVAGLGVVR